MAIQVILRHTNCIEGSTQKFKVETNDINVTMLSDICYEILLDSLIDLYSRN